MESPGKGLELFVSKRVGTLNSYVAIGANPSLLWGSGKWRDPKGLKPEAGMSVERSSKGREGLGSLKGDVPSSPVRGSGVCCN